MRMVAEVAVGHHEQAGMRAHGVRRRGDREHVERRLRDGVIAQHHTSRYGEHLVRTGEVEQFDTVVQQDADGERHDGGPPQGVRVASPIATARDLGRTMASVCPKGGADKR